MQMDPPDWNTPMSDPKRLLGRRAERAALDSAAADALSGGGGLVLLTGEAGVGKTRLAESFLADGDLSPLRARAQTEGARAYGLLRPILVEGHRRLEPDAHESLSLLPHLALLDPSLGDPYHAHAELIPEAAGQLLRHLASCGILCIFLDELNAADHASLEALRTMILGGEGESLVFLATCRNEELARDHPLRRLRAELAQHDRIREIELKPLDEEDATRLLADTLGKRPAPDLVELLLNRCQGVPLYLEEFARSLRDSARLRQGENGLELGEDEEELLPATLRDAVLLQLDQIPPRARELAEAAAVLGPESELPLVEEICGHDEGAIDLIEQGLIRMPQPDLMQFRHILVRDAVREEIAWSRRRSLHRRAAEVLSRKGPAYIAMLGPLWLAAGKTERAVKAFLAAAEEACHLNAFRDALASANAALEIWPEGSEEEDRLWALENLSRCASSSGQYPEAARALREVSNSPLLDGQPLRRAEALRALAASLSLQGLHEQARRARERAAVAFQEADEPGHAAEEHMAVADYLSGTLQYAGALDMARLAIDDAKEAQDNAVLARALSLEGDLRAVEGAADEARSLVRTGVALAMEDRDPRAICETHYREARVHEYLSRYPQARDGYLVTLRLSQEREQDEIAQRSVAALAWVHFRMGEWKRSEQLVQEILGDPYSSDALRGVAECVGGLLRAHRGQPRRARQRLQEGNRVARRQSNLLMEILVSWGLGVVGENQSGDEERAREEASKYYQQMLALWQRGEDRHDLIGGLCAAAGFFAEHHHEMHLERCVDALQRIVEANDNEEARAAVSLASGERALAAGRATEAVAHFEEAARGFGEVGVPLELARARRGHARALARAGVTVEAIRSYESALEEMLLLGARPLAVHLARELSVLAEDSPTLKSFEAQGS